MVEDLVKRCQLTSDGPRLPCFNGEPTERLSVTRLSSYYLHSASISPARESFGTDAEPTDSNFS